MTRQTKNYVAHYIRITPEQDASVRRISEDTGETIATTIRDCCASASTLRQQATLKKSGSKVGFRSFYLDVEYLP